MRRIVFRKTQRSTYEYTNQIFENGEWKFINRFIGKFGARPLVWYATKEWAEQFAPKDEEAKMVEWDGIDEEAYKNVFRPPTLDIIN